MPTKLPRIHTTGWIGLGAMGERRFLKLIINDERSSGRPCSNIANRLLITTLGHPMALNLFLKTNQFYQKVSPSVTPSFLFCEHDDSRAESFLRELRSRGGQDLASRAERVGSGKE